MEPLPTSTAEVAKQRLEKYVEDKLKEKFGDYPWEESIWEFYSFLLERAKQHRVDTSGYCSPEYEDDEKEALNNHKTLHPEWYTPPKVKGRKAPKTKNLAVDEPSFSSPAGGLA